MHARDHSRRPGGLLLLGCVLTILTALAPSTYAGEPSAKPAGTKQFSVPKALEPAFTVWLKTYTENDRNHVMLHDTQYMSVIYDTLDLSDIAPLGDPFAPFPPDIREARKARVDAAMEQVRAALLRLSDEPSRRDATPLERKIVQLFARIPGGASKYKDAAGPDRLRSQTGLRDRFRAGIVASGRYMAHIEHVFRDEKIPWEVSRLPFVESMFDLKAYSSVGASGIWQFMPGTAKLVGMSSNSVIDERNDPIAATRGAARLLRKNYEMLGSWPLAINAYNSGPGRLRSAVAQLGTTDIGTIATQYKGSGYGFASRNFYAEFLAALTTYEQRDRFFGGITLDPPLQFATVVTTHAVRLPAVADLAHLDMSTLRALNPGFASSIYTGSAILPAGYPIKVPRTAERATVAAMRQAGVPSIASK